MERGVENADGQSFLLEVRGKIEDAERRIRFHDPLFRRVKRKEVAVRKEDIHKMGRYEDQTDDGSEAGLASAESFR